VISNADLIQQGVARSSVDAPQIHNDRLALPKVFCNQEMFDANLWSMSGIKFLSGEFDLLPSREIQGNRSYPEANSGNEKESSEEGYGVARRLLPEGFALFCRPDCLVVW
jgi:hypothetical protein